MTRTIGKPKDTLLKKKETKKETARTMNDNTNNTFIYQRKIENIDESKVN